MSVPVRYAVSIDASGPGTKEQTENRARTREEGSAVILEDRVDRDKGHSSPELLAVSLSQAMKTNPLHHVLYFITGDLSPSNEPTSGCGHCFIFHSCIRAPFRTKNNSNRLLTFI